ncbi:MAG: hypothetical protein ACFCGT_04225 [Sandaracinaceae bacterium]
MTEPQDLDRALRTLPAHDVDAWRREHVRLRGHAVLEAAPRRPGIYRRLVEPALLVAFCSLHALWAVLSAASVLLR